MRKQIDFEAVKQTILESLDLDRVRLVALDLFDEVCRLRKLMPEREAKCECCDITFVVGGGNGRRTDKRHCSTVCRNKMFRRRKRCQIRR